MNSYQKESDDQDFDLTGEDVIGFLLDAFTRLGVDFYRSISRSDGADEGNVEN